MDNANSRVAFATENSIHYLIHECVDKTNRNIYWKDYGNQKSTIQ